MFGTNVRSRRRSRDHALRVSAVEELRQGAAKELQLRRAWELRFGAARELRRCDWKELRAGNLTKNFKFFWSCKRKFDF